MSRPRTFREGCRYGIENVLVRIWFGVMRVLPVETASRAGRWLGVTLGPRLGVTRRAKANLRRALPELDAAAGERVVRDMWANLGQVCAELPNIPRLGAAGRITFDGVEHVSASRADHDNLLIITGHFANWEALAYMGELASRLELHGATVYRPLNNRTVDRIVDRIRTHFGTETIPKGDRGARRILGRMRRGRFALALLADQKLNEGLRLDFMGHPAMTNASAARLARRFGAAIVPVRCVRTGLARYSLRFEPALTLPKSDDEAADILAVTRAMNDVYERWIRERPADWLWLHRRWVDT